MDDYKLTSMPLAAGHSMGKVHSTLRRNLGLNRQISFIFERLIHGDLIWNVSKGEIWVFPLGFGGHGLMNGPFDGFFFGSFFESIYIFFFGTN